MAQAPASYELLHVGSLSITKEALIIACGAVLTSLIIFGIAVFSNNHTVRIACIMMSVAVLAIGFYASYTTNCVIVGECHVLAWFFVGMFSLNFMIFISLAWMINSKITAMTQKLSPSKGPALKSK